MRVSGGAREGRKKQGGGGSELWPAERWGRPGEEEMRWWLGGAWWYFDGTLEDEVCRKEWYAPLAKSIFVLEK